MTSHRRTRGYRAPFDPNRHARPSDVQPLAADPMADALAAACKSLESWGATRVRYGVTAPVEFGAGDVRTLWMEATDEQGRVWRAELVSIDPGPMTALGVAAIILRGQGTEVTS